MSFVETIEENRSLPLFEESIYAHLPSILTKATQTMNLRQEKGLILIGSIATLSSVLLPFRTIFQAGQSSPTSSSSSPGRQDQAKADSTSATGSSAPSTTTNANSGSSHRKNTNRNSTAIAPFPKKRKPMPPHRSSPQSHSCESLPTAAPPHSLKRWPTTAIC